MLLFFLELRNDLQAIVSEVNPYDFCVSNKMIRDKKITITWHVDELKVSHSKKDIVDALIQWTKDTYEDITKLNPSRGKIHDYLAMNLDYTTSR